jgi:tRNA A37 methylthiotransferase MiaB
MILNRIQWPLKILKILNIIVETTQFAMNGIITTARRRYQLLKTLNIGKIHYITIDVMEKVKFEAVFNFKYSPRPLTVAQDLPNQIDDKIASQRLQEVIALHKTHQDEHMAKCVGTTMKVLFEDLKPNGEIFGFSDNYTQVFVQGSEELLGKIVDVKIIKASRTSLTGEVI